MIVDYGLGNIQAFLNVYKRLNIEAKAAGTVGELNGASKLILPGVGDFDHAMERLTRSGLRECLDDLVLGQHIPVLGICVGMQMLGRSSEEGSLPGLKWMNGEVKRLVSVDPEDALRVPHMGWNDVQPSPGVRLFEQLEQNARFYFLHSYYFACDRNEEVAAVTRYGCDFPCAVQSGNIYGVQFHPEKSHHFGTRLLKNYASL